MHRRHFLTSVAGAAAVLALKPVVGSQAAASSKTLVVIELAGGNDGLNTFIPYTDPTYLKLRPDLGIKDGVAVSSTVALHPALASWKPLIEQGQMAVIQNVGYPNPDLSHFRSKAIWQSASLEPNPSTGWLARYLDSTQAQTNDAIFLGAEYPLALMGDQSRYLHLAPNLAINAEGSLGQAIQNIYAEAQSNTLAEQIRQTVLESTDAVKELLQDLDQRVATRGYPRNGRSGRLLALTGHLIESGASVIYITVGGWDTHANQANPHQRLLEQLGQSVTALYQDLQAQGQDQQVLIMLQSEFGRRPAQNGSGGTDHGTAGPVILLGNVKGGFYGGDPNLNSLVEDNLPMAIDFRSVYAEILQQWLQVDPEAILNGSFPQVGVLA